MDVGRDLEQIRDYVAGRLSDVENRAFEDRLVRDPELVRELELAQRLREGLERLRERDELHGAIRRLPARRLVWAAGLAATLAGVAMLLWLQPGVRPASVLVSSMTPGTLAAARFTFVAMRGPSTAPVLNLPARGVVELGASGLPVARRTGYRVELDQLGPSGARVQVGALGGLESGADGLVRAYADAARLTPGDYELRLQAEADPAAGVEVFPFSLRRSAR